MFNKKGMLGNLIGGFIIIIVAICMLPTIADMVKEQETNITSSGASSTILGLTTFFALGIIGIALAFIANALRGIGLLGTGKEEKFEERIEKETTKQEETFNQLEQKEIKPKKRLKSKTPQLGVDEMEWNNKGGSV